MPVSELQCNFCSRHGSAAPESKEGEDWVEVRSQKRGLQSPLKQTVKSNGSPALVKEGSLTGRAIQLQLTVKEEKVDPPVPQENNLE